MIVAVVFVTVMMSYAVWNSFPVFFVAMFEEFGWSRGATAAAFSISTLVYGGSAPFCGTLLDRYGPRVVFPVGACLLALGLFASSRMDSLWQFYVYYGIVVAVGMNLIGAMTNSALIQQWFVRRRGVAVGIATSGVGLGTLIMVPLIQHIVNTYGWRVAYQILAVMTVVIVVPITAILQRHRPQDMGLQPDGVGSGAAQLSAAKDDADRLVVDRDWTQRDWTIRTAVRTRRFWLIFLAQVLATISLQTILVHGIAYLVDLHYDKMAAAFIFSLLGLTSALFRGPAGYVSDRIGREPACWIAGALTFAGTVGLLAAGLTGDARLVWLFPILFGIGYAASMPLIASVAGDVFQGRHFAAVFGLLYVGTGIGSAAGAWFGGYSHDVTGNYYIAFPVAAVAGLGCAAAFWLAAPRKVRTVAGRLRLEVSID